MDDLVEYELDSDSQLQRPEYLFTTSTGLVEFVAIEEELEQLHSFCLLSIGATKEKISNLNHQLNALETGKENHEVDGIDVSHDAAMGICDFELPMWQDTQEFLVRAMCLLLLAALMEKSLRSLCDVLSESGTKPKGSRGQSKVDVYLTFLQSQLPEAFVEPDEVKAVRERCRRLRNHFAHGEWDNVRENVGEQPLRQAFSVFARLFEVIEAKWS